MVEPNENVSGSTIVLCWLEAFVKGSVAIVVSATLASAVAAPPIVSAAVSATAARQRPRLETGAKLGNGSSFRRRDRRARDMRGLLRSAPGRNRGALDATCVWLCIVHPTAGCGRRSSRVRDNVRDPRAPAGRHKVVLDLRAAAALHLQKPKSEICRRQLVYKFIVLAGTVGALAVPAVAQAGDTPTATDRQNAAAECRAERGDTAATREAFKARYGTNHNQANAFGKCVSAKAREEAGERSDAETGAAKTCRTEQGTTPESQAAFEQKYGTNKNKHN